MKASRVTLALALFVTRPALAQLPSSAEVTAASCAACHGTHGHSVGGTPVLAGLDRDHFMRQMKDFAAGTRPGTIMPQLVRGLSDAQLRALAEFFAAQPR